MQPELYVVMLASEQAASAWSDTDLAYQRFASELPGGAALMCSGLTGLLLPVLGGTGFAGSCGSAMEHAHLAQRTDLHGPPSPCGSGWSSPDSAGGRRTRRFCSAPSQSQQ